MYFNFDLLLHMDKKCIQKIKALVTKRSANFTLLKRKLPTQ